MKFSRQIVSLRPVSMTDAQESKNNIVEECPFLPEEVELFTYQVGGHKHGKGRLGLGILKHRNGNILKPMFEADRRSDAELSFYETVFYHHHTDPILEEVKTHLATFCGTQIIKFPDKDVKYMCLEDISKHFQKPSVLDVKIGSRTYELNASEEKILEQKLKFLHGATLGIRIIGMKVYDDVKGTYTTKEKPFLRTLSPSTISGVLQEYFVKDRLINCLLLCGFLHKLQQIDYWFSKQRKFMFTGSSVLFMYESTVSLWMDWIECKCSLIPPMLDLATSLSKQPGSKQTGSQCAGDEKPDPSWQYSVPESDKCDTCGLNCGVCAEVQKNCNLYTVKMIDFAHTTPSAVEDTNYILGLRNLIEYFKSMQLQQ